MPHKYRSESNWLNADTWAFINSLSFKDYILAGNSVANLSANIPLQGDLDFWVQYTDDYIPILHEMMTWFTHMNIYPSVIELYNIEGILPRINLILTNMTPEETISRFDFDYCRCYWTPKTGIIYGEGCKESIETKIIKNPDYKTKNKRILKAVKYGYQFSPKFWHSHRELLKYWSINITIDDLDLSQFEYNTPTLSITNVNDVKQTLHELALQYQELLGNNSGLLVLLSFTDFKTNKNLITQYTTAIILINPMSNARYQDIRLGENFVYYYSHMENIDNILKSEKQGKRPSFDDYDYEISDIAPIRTPILDLLIENVKDQINILSTNRKEIIPRSESPLLIDTNQINILSSDCEEIIPIISRSESPLLIDTTQTNMDRKDQIYRGITPIYGCHQITQLNKSGTAYLMIDHLPDELSKLGASSFEAMYALHPKEKHKIIMYENEISVFRYSKAYLNTPCDLKHTSTRSYMYSGFVTDENTDPLPQLLTPFYEYLKTMDSKYNQVICNWYENQNDYIAPHSDCQRKMIPNAKIAILSLYDSEKIRVLEVTPKAGTHSLADKFTITLTHGSIVTMCGTTQNEFLHGIPQHETECGRRVSISFRQMAD